MPIARKPKTKPEISEKAISAVIDKGGTVSTAKNVENKPEQIVNIRLPENVLKEIDNAVAVRRIKISRHTWLMEAIFEKLDHENVS